MMALVSSDELAKDVTGAEALLERHQVMSQMFYGLFTGVAGKPCFILSYKAVTSVIFISVQY